MTFQWPLLGLFVAAGLYALGRRERDSLRRDACFYAGLLVIVAAIDSPVDTYADRLFWVHMVQHVLLTMVAPPLVLLGRPWPRSVRASGRRSPSGSGRDRRGHGRPIRRSGGATIISSTCCTMCTQKSRPA